MAVVIHSRVILIAATSLAAGAAHTMTVKRSKNARHFGRHDSGRYHMPGQMMTKAGKRMQMQKDFENCNRRKGRLR